MEQKAGPTRDDHHYNAGLVDQFKQDLNGELRGMLGIDKASRVRGSQPQAVGRQVDERHAGPLQRRCRGAKAADDRFDDDDNIVSTHVAAFHILTNDFDGGEELRLGILLRHGIRLQRIQPN